MMLHGDVLGLLCELARGSVEMDVLGEAVKAGSGLGWEQREAAAGAELHTRGHVRM